jgi:hypothetical protein
MSGAWLCKKNGHFSLNQPVALAHRAKGADCSETAIPGIGSPSRIASLHAAEIGASHIGGDRYLVAGRFVLDAATGHWRDPESEDRGRTIRSLIAAFEDAEMIGIVAAVRQDALET